MSMHSDAASQGGGWCALAQLTFIETAPVRETTAGRPPGTMFSVGTREEAIVSIGALFYYVGD